MLAKSLTSLYDGIAHCGRQPETLCLVVCELAFDMREALKTAWSAALGSEPSFSRVELRLPNSSVLLFRCATQRERMMGLRVHFYVNLARESWDELESNILRMMLQPLPHNAISSK